MASPKMDIPFIRCVEKVSYQLLFVALLTDLQRDKVVPAIPAVAFWCLDEGWSQLWLVVNRQYWARDH